MQFPATPSLKFLQTRRGYRATSMCTVFGWPAKVVFDLDDEVLHYSSFDIAIFDTSDMSWRTVHSLRSEELSQVPSSFQALDGAAKAALQAAADELHEIGTWIVATATAADREHSAQA
ncbi:hypothetical protein ACIBCD_42725 [Nocardia brasiliensis]|uniref:hypothetical protein n=1 Tax=Nocardia brasiliensis TaxID=37326 RepID=UPI0037AE75FC